MLGLSVCLVTFLIHEIWNGISYLLIGKSIALFLLSMWIDLLFNPLGNPVDVYACNLSSKIF